MPLIVQLGHGGSGEYGNSSYANMATGCVERLRLDRQHPLPCQDFYAPSAGGKPNAMLVGSMVHAYIEHELKGTLPEDGVLSFADDQCGWVPPQEWQDEAKRVYDGWVECRTGWGDGQTLGAELLLETEVKPGVPIQAKIDHLVTDPDGVICLEDFKTSAAKGDQYTRGRTRLQLHLYTMAAWANGYDVGRIRVRQIVKTKTVQEHIYDSFDLPTPSRERWIERYLDNALRRVQDAGRQQGPRGAECDYCRHAKSGACKL